LRIGVPRALLYYNYRPALEYLAGEDVAEIIVSSATNKLKLEQGLALCDDEVCLPVKVLMGHVQSLLGDVDALFLPRIISLEKKRYLCPKFLGLPDMVRAGLGRKTPLISPAINVGWSRLRQLREGIKSLGSMSGQPLKLWRALDRAARVQEQHRRQLAAALDMPVRRKRVAVLGHAYNIFDEYLNFGILNKLSALGVEPVTVENFRREHINQGASGLSKDLFWSYGREVVGAALYCLHSKVVDGVILVASFGCGPDSLITEIIGRRFSAAAIPLMSIILDEHSSGIGLATRVEAFVDMLNWRDMA
jgi:predicted nucleotide-binding protein (sugar kinase/HSP70/actin superfamily)